jgi:hypothetical protein
MTPGSHAFIGWWTANVVPLPRRDRLLIFLGGLLPDLDGLGLLWSQEAYFTYHHVLSHNLFAGLAWSALVGVLAQQRVVCVTQAFLNWHLHLACDYFGSRGPPDTDPWVLAYLYPLVGEWSAPAPMRPSHITAPAWYLNRWQWPINSWPNIVITLVAIAGFVYIAVRLGRTFFEFVLPKRDAEFCRSLRARLGVTGELGWSPREANLVRGSYVLILVVALLACVIAASTS